MAKLLIKRFEFTADDRRSFDLTGGLRISERHRLEIPKVGSYYDLTTTLTARTWTTEPQKLRALKGFQVEHPYPPASSTYTVRFRIWDGTDEWFWNGATWTAPVVEATDWNTEVQMSDNIETFTGAVFGFTINAQTSDKLYTPSLKAIKVLYEAEIVELADLIYDSLIPQLQALRPLASLLYAMPALNDEISWVDPLGDLQIETPYEIDAVVAAYDHVADPKHRVNLLASYNTGTKLVTLTEELAADVLVWLDFTYIPPVGVQTSPDFYEVSKVPAIEIYDVETSKLNSELGVPDSVFGSDGQGWKVHGPRLENVTVMLHALADKQRDVYELSSKILQWGASRSITLTGTDEGLAMHVESSSDDRSSPNNASLRRIVTSITIYRLPVYELPATQVARLTGMAFNLGDTVLALPEE